MDQRLNPARKVAEKQHGSFLPHDSPCAMPDQNLWRDGTPGSSNRGRVARFVMLGLWAGVTVAFSYTLYRVLSVEAPTWLQLVFLVLSTACFAWVAAGSATALIGFVMLLRSRGIDTLDMPEARPERLWRTALLFPVYREDPAEVAAIIDTVCQDLVAVGANQQFDVFILSDTQSASERRSELDVYDMLRQRHAGKVQIFVHWRTPNVGKKSGNVREWVGRFGAAYLYFVIFDADSIMSAQTLRRLVAAMDADPRAGLIQTVPMLVGGQTLFARLQQFAGAYYGRILAAGLAAWHGDGGNYWGHNAIIRTKAFAQSSGLPTLSGSPPLGGHILSHDFVEAALLRRSGWGVHMAPSLDGSYEGCPPTMPDLMTRDRRWAQGNLQHLRLLGVSGLPLLSRLHLAMGAMSYIASPLWATTLIVGVILAIQGAYAMPSYFGTGPSLFPKWPVFDAQTALALFVATLVAVHLPKLLGAAWALRSANERARNGGVARVIGGVVVESLLSTLIAPALMVAQTGAVASILLGRDAGWNAQQRVAGNGGLSAYLLVYRWQMLWGVAAAVLCSFISWPILAWMSPIILGLLLGPPLALLSARRATPLLCALLATPEERCRPQLLATLHERRSHWRMHASSRGSEPNDPPAVSVDGGTGSRRSEMAIDASQIREHMKVVGSDGRHIGTVNRVEGNKIKLTKKDAGDAHHRYVDLNEVDGVKNGEVCLNKTAKAH